MTIKILPIGDGQQDLTVEDAMRQVLDVFELMRYAGGADEEGIVWRLVKASTNSPLTVVAEATPKQPGVDATAVARHQKRAFAHGLDELRRGRTPRAWSGAKAKGSVSRLFRNRAPYIGTTEIELEPDLPQVRIDSDGIKMKLPAAEVLQVDAVSRARTERGSIEGLLLEVTTHYQRPAVKVRDRVTNQEIWCLIPEYLQEIIARSASFDDVWRHKRVIVRGTVTYDDAGDITRVEAKAVELVSPRSVGIEEIQDAEFTNGLDALQYLERIRDGG